VIGLQNKDSAFFLIESPDIKTEFQNISRQVISFSYTEEMQLLGQGSITLYDPDLALARMFRVGAKLLISFGYKKTDTALQSQLGNMMNANELIGQIERRGILAYITNPSGSASNQGVITFNMNFAEFGYRGNIEEIVYTTGTKADVVSQVFDKLGVSRVYRDIRFDRGREPVNNYLSIRQEETSFKFLSNKAYEWQALFKIAYTQSGDVAGMFLSPRYLGTSSFQNQLLQATGSSNYFDYRGKVSNVISYSWENKEGESGTGDNTMLSIVDGQIIARKYIAEQQKVITYRLNPDKIAEHLKQADATSGIQGQVEYVGNMLNQNDFQALIRDGYFTPIEQMTAPQGYGYTINLRVIGNPLITPPNQAYFGDNFPDNIGVALGEAQNKIKWFIRKATHNISMAGYMTDIEIVDAFSISPTGELM
jgi:hypothetical protein